MLQAALLLLGCALSRYLWEINTTIASVVIGVTSIGVAFYIFIVVAGSASETCPYQTPGSRILRAVVTSAPVTIISAFRRAIERSEIIRMIKKKKRWSEPWQSRSNVKAFTRRVLRELPGALVLDTFCLGRVAIRPLVAFARRVYTLLFGVSSGLAHGFGQHTAVLDIQCISWILRTSLDKADRLSSLGSLATMAVLPDEFDPTLVADCFSVFVGCVKVVDNTVTITQGLEQLAAASATCLLRTFSHLSFVDPKSGILRSVFRNYNGVFPSPANFDGLPSSHTFHIIHGVLNQGVDHQSFGWGDYKLSNHEHIIFASALAKFTCYQRRVCGKKVPRWVLRFTLHSLSLDPLPSTSVVVDCLSIIAIDLGCDILSTRLTVLDKRYVYTNQTLISLTQIKCTIE